MTLGADGQACVIVSMYSHCSHFAEGKKRVHRERLNSELGMRLKQGKLGALAIHAIPWWLRM